MSNGDKKDLAKKHLKTTQEEEERDLLATSAGQESWKANQVEAEKYYLQALMLEDPVATAYRGLGMLYEKLGRSNDAAAQYEKYLSLAPNSADHDRIQRHLESLKIKQ